MQNVEIRPAIESDLSRILPMLMSLQRLTDSFNPLGFGAPSEALQIQQLQDTLDNVFHSELGLILVAERNRTLVGCLASCKFIKEGYQYSNSAVLFSLWVTPNERNQKIASTLVHNMSEQLKQQGVESLQVGWHPGNPQASGFWAKHGFFGYEVVAAKKLSNSPK